MSFKNKFFFEFKKGHYLIKLLENEQELIKAQKLRYEVFLKDKKNEALEENIFENEKNNYLDQDEFDLLADHIGIFDIKNNLLIATCRLNHSDFCKKYYSEQEFTLQPILNSNLKKLELGRVCVHLKYQKGIIIFLLWRAIAQYIKISKAELLFGCGSVATEDPEEAYVIYKFLQEQDIAKLIPDVAPTPYYTSEEFEKKRLGSYTKLTFDETQTALKLLPPLCRSYFEMGCFVPTTPAFDKAFKCIDFLTVLNIKEMIPSLKKKLFGADFEI